MNKTTTQAQGEARIKRVCIHSGYVLAEMCCANFTRQEVLKYEPRPRPERCACCGAVRRPQWVRRNLGGPSSGCWQWSLIFPWHTTVNRPRETD